MVEQEMRARSARRTLVAALTASAVLCLSGTASRAQGAHHGGGQSIDPPIQLAYVCGNTFLVTNALPMPVTFGLRVGGARQDQAVRVEAAPDADPAYSETLIEARGPGTVELLLKNRRVAVMDNGGVPCVEPAAAPAAAAAATAPDPAVQGKWSRLIDWPIVAVHLHLLPDGQVLSWGLRGQPHLWNPETNDFTQVWLPDEVFCAGHALLEDGRLLVAGGHIDNRIGLPDVNLFGDTGWESAAPMAWGRWYPTVTIMADGRAVILAGTDEDGANVPVPEVWSSGRLTTLPAASRSFPYYPRAFLAPNGRLFYAGEEITTRYLNPNGAGRWTTVATRKVADREYGSAVMYRPGKILYAGGGRTTNTAEVIKLNAAKPTWTLAAPMAFARRHHNLTVLADGDVLATGGVAGTTFNDLSKPALAAELWDPKRDRWRQLAKSAVVRGYHGSSILLPDGRVLHTGGGDAANAPRQLNAELFSPPYLFAGPRPRITAAPAALRYGTQLPGERPPTHPRSGR